MSALENLISIVSSSRDNTVLRQLKMSSENFLMKLKLNVSFDRARLPILSKTSHEKYLLSILFSDTMHQ